MDISVPSRFACLKIEDDDGSKAHSKNPKKKPEPKPTAALKPKKTNNNKPSTSKKTKSAKQNDPQWEEWKKKDSEYVDDNFEHDMQSAILASQLEFEAAKKNGVKPPPQGGNKKKKNKTMHLDEFLEGPEKSSSKPEVVIQNDNGFFQRMADQVKKEVIKGKVEESRKEREVNIDEIVSLAQCQEKLKKELERNGELQNELEKAQKEIQSLKEEMVEVKDRNMLFCNILGHGEMRGKADILLELEKLTSVRNELTEEVQNLHKLLEQERSKSVGDASKKDKVVKKDEIWKK